ncbi:DUF1488 family protein [Noviherbaspirillum malthae]|uniref:DUF1488 family protein n=1 Tax=Noviherbaspirillum malthae TaxID=1260987 RepID=UPI00188F5994|nr:DUF1488 family protein [Noviherbaspirillum malthae]
MDNTTPVRPTPDGVTFSVNIGAHERECLISREALDTLSQLKNIDSSDADTLELFKAFETFIRPVAQSIFGGAVHQTPLLLTSENLKSAYRSPMEFQSAMCMTELVSQTGARKNCAP